MTGDAGPVVRLARVEGRLARPFADRGATLGSFQLDEARLRALRDEVTALLNRPEATAAREAFRDMYERALRGTDVDPPEPKASTPSPVSLEAGPAIVDATAPPEVSPVKPSYLLAVPSENVDATAPPRMARPGPTLPFVEGDARAFVAAALRDRPVAPADDADVTQALSAVVAPTALPFETEVERSLEVFVDFLATLTAHPGQEDAIGARFGVASASARERVLARWRARWEADPKLRDEWQRLYAQRTSPARSGG